MNYYMPAFNWLSSIKNDFISNLLDFHYLLFAFSIVLFSDTYLLVTYGVTIRNIDIRWLNAHANVTAGLSFCFALLVFYSTLIPLVQIVGQWLFGLISDRMYGPSEGYFPLYSAKQLALKDNNLALYLEIDSQYSQKSKNTRLHAISLSIVLLAIAGYCFSGPQHQGLVQYLYIKINECRWYFIVPLDILVGLMTIGIIALSLKFNREADSYVKLTHLANDRMEVKELDLSTLGG